MKAKSMISIILVIFILLGTGSAFAVEPNAGSVRNAVQLRQEPDRTQQMIQNREEIREQVQERVYKIEAYRYQLTALNAELRQKMMLIQKNNVALCQNTEAVTEKNMLLIKEKLQLIRQNRRQFEATLGEIRAESLLMRGNRLKQNLEGIAGNMDNILQVQEARIRILKNMIEDADSLLTIIEEINS